MVQNRATRQRTQLDAVVQTMTGFYTAQDLHDKAKNTIPSLGIATVYRYLRAAAANATIHEYTCERKSLYSTKKQSHCHFTCEETGQVIHFDIDSLDFLKNKIPGTIHSFQIEVRGVCTRKKHRHH